MLKAAIDSVIEVAPPGIGRGRQTLVKDVRIRRLVRSRMQLDLDILDCGEAGADILYCLPAGRRSCQKV